MVLLLMGALLDEYERGRVQENLVNWKEQTGYPTTSWHKVSHICILPQWFSYYDEPKKIHQHLNKLKQWQEIPLCYVDARYWVCLP